MKYVRQQYFQNFLSKDFFVTIIQAAGRCGRRDQPSNYYLMVGIGDIDQRVCRIFVRKRVYFFSLEQAVQY
jgi:hypothetical protein